MPISYQGVYHYRSGATKQQFRGVALHQFLLKKMGLNWEDIPCEGTSLDDIDDAAIDYFLAHAIGEGRMNPELRGASKMEVLSNLGLINDDVPTNGAILLFGKYPQRKFATSSFKIGRFGADDADLLSQDQIEGNLIQMTDRIMQVLSSKYLVRPIHYDGLRRKEPLEIPEEALRELIFNSIVHKVQFGTWNQMSIYDDHIRLWNEGVLPEGFTVETLMSKHSSKPRNPKMAQVFYRAGFIEAWGRGYEKIMKAFDSANLKCPEFIIEQGGISAIIHREIFLSIRDNKILCQADTEPGQADIEPGQADIEPDQADIERNRNRYKTEERTIIIEAIKENPSITMDALSDLLYITKSSVQRRMKALVKEGRIRHIGPTKGGYWEVIDEH